MEMVSNIDVLTEKIYREGVEKAEIESTELLTQAKKQADDILNLANEKADRILNKAQKEAEVIRRNVTADIHLAGIQAINVIKQQIRDLLVYRLVKKPLKTLFSDEKFLEKLILTISGQFKGEEDLQLVIPENMKIEADSAFYTSVLDVFEKENILFSNDIVKGFEIKSKGKDFYISFTDKDFVEFIRPYVHDKTDEVLFQQPPS